MTSIDWTKFVDWIAQGLIGVVFGAVSFYIAHSISRRWEQKKEREKKGLEARNRWLMSNGLPPANVVEAVRQAKREGYSENTVHPYVGPPWWLRRDIIIAVGSLVVVLIVFGFVSSPKIRDYAHLVVASPDDRRCYFSSIVTPIADFGFTTKNTPIRWEPSNCVMVIQSYQDDVGLTELKGQRSNKVTVGQMAGEGRTVIKIFREGFELESSNVWIYVTP